MLSAFQLINRVRIVVSVGLAQHRGKPDMLFSATATDLAEELSAQVPSASVNAICWGSDMKSLVGVYTTLLYRLDFQLAERELAGKGSSG